MSRIPRIRRWLSVPATLAKNCGQLPPPSSSANWAEGSPSPDICSAVGWLSFRRFVDIPFDACLAALESWQLHRTGRRTPPRPGPRARADRARPRLRHMPDPGPPGPRAAAPATAHEARHRPLVLLTHRPRTHPVPAHPAHRRLLPRRPPPAGLLDPRTAGMCPEYVQDHISEAAPSRCPAAAARAGSFRDRLTAGCCQRGSTSRSQPAAGAVRNLRRLIPRRVPGSHLMIPSPNITAKRCSA